MRHKSDAKAHSTEAATEKALRESHARLAEAQRVEAVMAARLRLVEHASDHGLDILLQKVLDEAELLTGSSIGFFHTLMEDQKTLTLTAWSTNTLKTLCKAEGRGTHYSIDKAGVWVDCVHLRQPVIHNDYASLLHKKGLPPGHAPVVRQITAPVIRGDQIQAILGVGNKPTLYDNNDLETLLLLANLAWDIVQRKKAEEERAELEEKNKLLQKADSLGRMAGAVAHHFNNHLQVVLGNLEMISNGMTPGSKAHHQVSIAMRAAHRAAEVSTLMLTYLGVTTQEQKPLDIAQTMQNCLTALLETLPDSILLNTELKTPGPFVKANEGQLKAILTNLIINASEAIGNRKGTIQLSIDTVSSDKIPSRHRFPAGWQPEHHAYACLKVSDDGCGILDQDIEKLFDPFYSTKFTGRGLGLSVVLGMVKTHGGAITVKSKPDQGTTFHIYFPVASGDQHFDAITGIRRITW